MNISLPPGVSFRKEQTSIGQAFIFRHQDIGELGRIVLKDLTKGQCHITSEVVGDPDDPMTKKREAMFIPLSKKVTDMLELIFAESSEKPSTSNNPTPDAQEIVESKLIPCDKCGKNLAMLIFSYDAVKPGQFEDYARRMYPKYTSLNVATWIIGKPETNTGDQRTPTPIMKVWPDRTPIKTSTAEKFNAELDNLIENHC